MASLDDLFSSLLGLGFGRRRGLSASLGGGLAGGLLGSLLGGRSRKRFGRTAGLGALAAVGALAYRAWRDAQERRPRRVENETVVVPTSVAPEEELAPAPPDSGFVPRDPAEAEALELLLVRAMIAAAHADGRLDGDESSRILDQVDALELEPGDKALLLDELRSPASVGELAAAARTPQQALEVYTASLLAVEVDSALERSHLRRLASALELEPELVASVEAHAGPRD